MNLDRLVMATEGPLASSSLLSNRPSSSGSPTNTNIRRQSAISFDSSTMSNNSLTSHSFSGDTSPRVQLVPHVHKMSYDSSLTQSEKKILDGTSFDAMDLSSKDFDFDDIFTYSNPQKRLGSVVEAQSSSRERERTILLLSQHIPTPAIKQKSNRRSSGFADVYVKKKGDARKR